MGSLGCSPHYRGGTDFDGIFARPLPAASLGRIMEGTRIAEITDGTSNTAMFSEVRRGSFPAGSGALFDNTTSMIGGTYTSGIDGRNITECNNVAGTKIHYVGQQYYRALPQNYLYTHTLPINWNKKVTGTAGQKYICGNTSFTAIHQAASSYHPGIAVVGLADGSVRPVAETIDFVAWQEVGTRARGVPAQLP
jgi:hypothetical protein